ncbi:protein HEADING DATE 3B-like isoform X2 [Mangifera indica]|uniref:protein HEADING DATE 3B-like isoform X2 n=1 Tax=Mangifera indica TaxID=29780 RepID=UPI001CF98965|nr:protein HEADING DATE 3B-like isoform X2 [Mangifera indica]
MRGGKDEIKVTSPMFPRLHVNDTEKGGPRAPPRNKMALYEQLSVPSQRLGSGSASMLPLPPSNGSNLVPSMSSSNGGGHERSVLSQFCNSPTPPFISEKIHSYFSSGIKRNTMMINQEWETMTPSNYQSLNAAGPLSSTAHSSSFKPSNFSNFRNFAFKKLGDENDLRVPSSAQLGIAPQCRNSQHSKDKKYKVKKGPGPGDLNSRSSEKNQNEENAKVSETSQDPEGRSTLKPLSGDRNLADTSSSLVPKVKHLESLKRACSSLNQENRSSSIDILNDLHGTNARLHLESEALRDEMVLRDGILIETMTDMDKENCSKVRNESCLRPSLGDNNIIPYEIENCNEYLEEQNGISVQVREVDRHDDVSSTSMVDSPSALVISPDDIVGFIGEKQFWKVRRAIINQQRVFEVQVFELHRLMKVQKLIAKSPHLLSEDNLYIKKPSLNVPQVKRMRSQYDLETSPRIVKAKDHSEKPDLNAESADENAVANLPHSSVNNDTSKGLGTQQSNYLVNEPTAAPTRNIKPSPWCFPPPGNQWLVSVMSPSEGLVYKPYTGPCPPTAGFVAPIYGSCGPMSLNPASGHFLNTAYGIPALHHQGFGILPGNTPLDQTYFPPYDMPLMNPSVSGSAVEQMSPFPAARSKDDHFSMVDINFMIPHQSSLNMPSPVSHFGKFQVSKESEVQGSTASSPCERATGDALPLFPMEPIVQASINDQTCEKQTQVIKVVPHNRRLATESAARIFQSIQEERKHYD